VLATGPRHWPPILDAMGRADPMARRVALMRRQAEAWAAHPPVDPVIAAGSTGSHPATARLLAAIAAMPSGAVVLPGLDRDLDAESWEALAPSHPQSGLKQLLAVIGCDRDAVADWVTMPPPPPRAALLREVFRPAATAGAWTDLRLPAAATGGMFRLDCANPREEAPAIALILREPLETPGRTAALVTPDRDLAQRVAEQMRRWGVEIDDSAGVPLGQTPVGRFLRLVAAAALDGFSPVALLAVLRHPLCARTGGGGARAAADFDCYLARGPKPAPGWGDYRRRLDELDEGNKLSAPRLLALSSLIELLAAAVAPFAGVLCRAAADLPTLIRAHVACVEALAANVETEGGGAVARRRRRGGARLPGRGAGRRRRPGGDIPRRLRRGLRFPGRGRGGAPGLRRASAPARPGADGGPFATRRRDGLGGMNEGAWPRDPAPDPWMSRGMRAAFGLPPPERRSVWRRTTC
jgi:ATP-dependent helicase/nuclease subunit B